MDLNKILSVITIEINLKISKLESDLEDAINNKNFISNDEKSDKIIEILKEITTYTHMGDKWLSYINQNNNEQKK